MTENRKEEKFNSSSSLVNGFITEGNLRNGRATEAAWRTQDNIEKVSKAYEKTRTEQLAGRLAEEHHAGSFNINASRAGRYDLAAKTNGSNGNPHAAADIVITKNGSAVSEAQVKYCGTTAKTTFELSAPKYDGMQKIHPSDQAVASLAGKRGVSGTGEHNFPDTAQNASPTLQHEGIQSDPMTYGEAQELATDVRYAKTLVFGEMFTAVKYAAATAFVVTSIISVVGNVSKVVKGEKKPGDAALDVARDTATGTADGAAKAVVTVAIKTRLRTLGPVLAESSAPVAFGSFLIDTLKDTYQFANGDITGLQFATNTGTNAASGAAALGGAELGVMVGTAIFPGLGTIVGGIVGGIACSICAGHLLSWIIT